MNYIIEILFRLFNGVSLNIKEVEDHQTGCNHYLSWNITDSRMRGSCQGDYAQHTVFCSYCGQRYEACSDLSVWMKTKTIKQRQFPITYLAKI